MPKKDNITTKIYFMFFGAVMLLYTIYYWYFKDDYLKDIMFYKFSEQSGRSKTKLVNLPLHLLDKNFGKSIALVVYSVISVFCLGFGYALRNFRSR